MTRVIFCVLALAAAACVDKPKPIDLELIGEPDEIQPGPGLFSGEDGAFTVEL